jgi:DTW domain-containing protein YfiP
LCELRWPDWAAQTGLIRKLDAITWKNEYLFMHRLQRSGSDANVAPERYRLDVAARRSAGAADGRTACARCWRPTRTCICAALPSQPFNNCAARVVVILHPRCQTKNGTLRTLLLGLRHCQVVTGLDVTGPAVHGDPLLAPLQSVLDDVKAKARILLWPSKYSRTLETLVAERSPLLPSMVEEGAGTDAGSAGARCHCGRPEGHDYVHLIAIDGSWRQAKQIGASMLSTDGADWRRGRPFNQDDKGQRRE